MLITLLFGLTETVFVSENVVFHKTNDISTVQAKWLASFVIDLHPFGQFITKLENDTHLATVIAECIVAKYQHPKHAEYLTSFENLEKEIIYLNETRTHLFQGLLDYKLMRNREKRALIPIIGDAASWLFGLVTESDIVNLRKNIANLARNQKQIIHVVQESISVLNTTRFQVAENRHAILELGSSVHQLNSKLEALVTEVKREIYETRYFLEMYLKLDLIITEIKNMLQNAMFYLEHLKTQLNFLCLGRLSPSTISPRNLRSLLLDIKAHLPSSLALMGDPNKNLWLFYQQLTTTALLDENRIVVIIRIPLLRNNHKFEIYKAYNLPLPVKDIQTDNMKAPDLIATYDLEGDGIMVDKERTNFALLTKYETDICSNPVVKWCNVKSPIFPINLARLCIINLFLKNQEAAAKFCKSVVTLNTRLPLGINLFGSVWAVASRTELKFSIVCQTGKRETRIIKPPVSLLKIPASCSASNAYMSLGSSYDASSSFDFPDSDMDLLQHINISQFRIWSPLIETLPNFTKISLPSSLKQIPQIPLDNLINELQYLETTGVQTSKWSVWTYIIIGSCILIAVLIVRYMYMKYGRKLVSLCSAMQTKCRSEAVDTKPNQRVNVGSTEVECQELTTDGSTPSAPTTVSNETEAINSLYPMLFEPARVTHM